MSISALIEKQTRYKCPYCGHTILKFSEKASASGIYIKCRGQGCGKIVEIKIEK